MSIPIPLLNHPVILLLIGLVVITLVIGLLKFFIKAIWHLIFWCCFIAVLIGIGVVLGKLFLR